MIRAWPGLPHNSLCNYSVENYILTCHVIEFYINFGMLTRDYLGSFFLLLLFFIIQRSHGTVNMRSLETLAFSHHRIIAFINCIIWRRARIVIGSFFSSRCTTPKAEMSCDGSRVPCMLIKRKIWIFGFLSVSLRFSLSTPSYFRMFPLVFLFPELVCVGRW